MTLLGHAQRIHLVGIGGVGVSAVARALRELGHHVTGSDRRASSITAALIDEGIHVQIGHDPALALAADRIGHSGAVPSDDAELVAARAHGIPVHHRAELLAAIVATRAPAVAVMGTHGKGTVAAMLVAILEAAGRTPSFVIGAQLHDFARANARITSAGPIVAEVDESDGSHDQVRTDVVVLTNLEADHLNFYADLAAIEASIGASLAANPRLRRVIVNTRCAAVAPSAARTTFALGAHPGDADVVGIIAGTAPAPRAVTIWSRGVNLGEVELIVSGAHNLENAVAAAAAALSLGVAFADVRSGLAGYHGLVNRMSARACGRARVITDFVSHASGIREVLRTLAADPRPIVALFRPYRYTLIRYLGDEYVRAFARAARVIVTDLDSGGETPLPGGGTADLLARLRGGGLTVEHVPAAALADRVRALVGEAIQLVVFGGDDLFELVERATAAVG
jgi:UDP-N-acetylmuramate--alanine ligase